MTVLSPPRPVSTAAIAFPIAEVTTALHDELILAARSEAQMRGLALPAAAADVARTALQVDSLVAVGILCTLEPILGLELPEKLVRAGGYASADEALTQLLPRIEQYWKKKTGA